MPQNYTPMNNVSNMTSGDFALAVMTQAAPIGYRARSLLELFKTMRDNIVDRVEKIKDIMCDALDLTRSKSNILNQYLSTLMSGTFPHSNADGTEIRYISLVTIAGGLIDAIRDGSNVIHIPAIDDTPAEDLDLDDTLSQLAGQADVSILQCAAFEATMSDDKTGAITILESAKDRISSINLPGLLPTIGEITSFITANFSNKVSLYTYVLNSFGYSQDIAIIGRGNVWSGITNFSPWTNFLVGIGTVTSYALNFAYTVISTALNILVRVINFVIEGVTSLLEKGVQKLRDDFFFSTVGVAITTTSSHYGFSSTYNRTFTTPATSYATWYFFTHGMLDGYGMTLTFLNVRLNIVAQYTQDIDKTISWNDWQQSTPDVMLVGRISVCPIYGPYLLSFCRKLGSDGMFDLCSTYVRPSGKSQDAVMNADYSTDDMEPWGLSVDEWNISLDIMSRFKCEELTPKANEDVRAIARSFLYGHAMANLALAFPFDSLDFGGETSFLDWLYGKEKLRNWFCLFLKQMFYWGCINVGPSMQTNDLSVGFRSGTDQSVYYQRTKPANVIWSDWGPSYFACCQWAHFLDTYDSFLGDTQPANGTFASNVWFANIISQAVSSDWSSIVNYTDCDLSETYIRDLNGTLYGAVDSALGQGVEPGAQGGQRNDLWRRISNMVLHAWNEHSYIGTFGPVVTSDPSATDNDYYILTDQEEAASAAAFQSALATRVIITAAAIGLIAIGVKIFKAWRSATMIADTAAFNYGDAMAKGDLTAANEYMDIYKRNHRVSVLLSGLAPSRASSTFAALAAPSNPASSLDEDNLSTGLLELRTLIHG